MSWEVSWKELFNLVLIKWKISTFILKELNLNLQTYFFLSFITICCFCLFIIKTLYSSYRVEYFECLHAMLPVVH